MSAPSKCVICGKSQDAAFKPFCSKRCADVDLNRWLKGGYSIPASEEDEGQSQPGANDDASRD